ncbi:hypothetical protein HMPREF1581_01305 [Gardnerella vaginalis JCP8108]|uniref:Uncharacterized protein n=1 Tax=Gardnerella vaginalis JCP8108 TaxID=1261066 RepID=S4GNB3_GARVA|nr:hypothetical protein HMPREF1581_01305 [Gardnerella vaginalis JCP8108]
MRHIIAQSHVYTKASIISYLAYKHTTDSLDLYHSLDICNAFWLILVIFASLMRQI